eukprot:TRINITY_DN15628_c0_g1_i13.p1 TRINITY_DN15628_c0_g1~~TRINITY_DN15628_c0_g1_i13.p1  ORF type:complete len:340 (-),score=58.78 TRINITY_DN15628_c0_g1_i13:11-901(-)
MLGNLVVNSSTQTIQDQPEKGLPSLTIVTKVGKQQSSLIFRAEAKDLQRWKTVITALKAVDLRKQKEEKEKKEARKSSFSIISPLKKSSDATPSIAPTTTRVSSFSFSGLFSSATSPPPLQDKDSKEGDSDDEKQEVLHKGTLLCRMGVFKSWMACFFKLYSDRLCFFRNATATKVLGEYEITGATKIEALEYENKAALAFTPDLGLATTHYLLSPDGDEQRRLIWYDKNIKGEYNRKYQRDFRNKGFFLETREEWKDIATFLQTSPCRWVVMSSGQIGRAVQQECRDRSRMPSSA